MINHVNTGSPLLASAVWEYQQSYIAVGYLLSELFGESEELYDFITARKTRVLPFGSTTARKLRVVSDAVYGGRLEVDLLPLSYAAAFEFATMSPDLLAKAKEDGLLRADVTEQQIKRWKKRHAPAADPNARLAKLKDRRRRHEASLAKIEEEIANLRASLRPDRIA